MRTSKLCHFFLACALFLPSCNRQQLGPGDGYVLIGDRSDAARERIYIIHEDMVFVADHIFPGYQDRKYYTSTLDDMSVLSEIEMFDDLSAPFAPGGPTGYCRVINAEGIPEGELYFDAIDGPAVPLLDRVENATFKNRVEVQAVPAWVQEKPELMRLLAL